MCAEDGDTPFEASDDSAESRVATAEGQTAARLIFVVGAGRSGTHLLGRVLATYPNSIVRFE
jgi:hypothetical protein